MKRITGIPGMFLVSLCIFPQLSLIRENHIPRAGDEIIKQQVEYKDPGRSGENVLWDFSTLNPVNEAYTLSYTAPELLPGEIYVMGKDTFPAASVREGELVIGKEHFTRYFYRLREDRMEVLGHRNRVSEVHHMPGVPVLNFSGYLQQTHETTAVYSGKQALYVNGVTEIAPDATGLLILPDKDTVRQVIRVCSLQHLLENTDSLEKKLSLIPDSLRGEYPAHPLHNLIETHRWYARGYRYPVFETVKTTQYTEEGETVYFTTAFFYPPQNHYYLWNDPQNLAVRLEEENRKNGEGNPGAGPAVGFTYNLYPNPVESRLTVEYYTSVPCAVEAVLHDMQGRIRFQQAYIHGQSGIYIQDVDMDTCEKGHYLLTLQVGDSTFSEYVIKK